MMEEGIVTALGTIVDTLGLVGAVIFLTILSGRAFYDFVKKNQEQVAQTIDHHFKQTENLVDAFKFELNETRKDFKKEISEARKEHREDRLAFQVAVNDLSGEIQEVKEALGKIKQ